MLLGKRARPPMKRTASMTEITFDLSPNVDESEPSDPHNPFKGFYQGYTANFGTNNMASPRSNSTNYRRNSADFVDTAHFLRSCGLCKRPLVPTRDIYMYRGDTAFCSLECRQNQMNQDERVEKKCSIMASKKDVVVSSNNSASPVTAANAETVTAS